MKTTIDIPEALYTKAKIRAIETGRTLKELVITSLEKELEPSDKVREDKAPYWANRKLLPDFQKYWESETPVNGMDSTQIISEERDAR